MSITDDFRPKRFSDLAGQELVKSVLKSIIANPKTAPKTLIFQGEYGTGKTSAARMLCLYLNCLNKDGRGNPCLKCENCLNPTKRYLYEFDSTALNKEGVLNIKENIYPVQKGYNVVIFDEVHCIKEAAQSALLKELEEPIANTFYVLCTTAEDENDETSKPKILPTIKSRALTLTFNTIPETGVKTNLRKIANSKGIIIDEESMEIMLQRANGHLRDAHKQLDLYILLGEEYKYSLQNYTELIQNYMISVLTQDKDMLYKAMKNLSACPVTTLKNSFNKYITEMAKQMVGVTSTIDISLKDYISKGYELKLYCLLREFSAEWFQYSFKSDLNLETALLCIYQSWGFILDDIDRELKASEIDRAPMTNSEYAQKNYTLSNGFIDKKWMK